MHKLHWVISLLILPNINARYLINIITQFKSEMAGISKKDMRRVTKSRCVNGLICATCDCCMLSQESWISSTLLWQHATVACRTNKPFYTARFCRTSHVFVPSCKLALIRARSMFKKTYSSCIMYIQPEKRFIVCLFIDLRMVKTFRPHLKFEEACHTQ